MIAHMENKSLLYYSNTRPEMTSFIKSMPQRILEIGCGAGGFRGNFPDDIEYWGVEPCETAAAAARQVLTRTLIGTYDSTRDKIPAHYFDLIVCNDVIEHMPDPKAFLRDIRGKLSNNGEMIASVPNLRNAVTLYELLIKGDFTYISAGVLDYTHLHLFTKKSFIKMALECGWAIEKCEPLPPQPFKPVKNLLLNFIKPFIPEIKSNQIAARLSPNTNCNC